MPRVQDRTVPHGTFTEHWIRVAAAGSAPRRARRKREGPIEPYYERDKTGPEARIYGGMGPIVYATLANNAQFILGVAYEQLGKPQDAIRALAQAMSAQDGLRPQSTVSISARWRSSQRWPGSARSMPTFGIVRQRDK